ncbi:hypothetical protein ACCD09_24345 [Variovorax sp. Varisp62]
MEMLEAPEEGGFLQRAGMVCGGSGVTVSRITPPPITLPSVVVRAPPSLRA